MEKIKQLFKDKKMPLIVSLPENSYELAKICWENGADAVKFHIDLTHNASKNLFGSLAENKKVFEKILKDSPVPVGIVIGNTVDLAEKNIDEVIQMGFDFISLYGKDMPVALGFNRKIVTFYAISTDYTLNEVMSLSDKRADVLEISIMQSNTYGRRLTLQDINYYELISKNASIPTLLPTQLNVKPSDIKALYDAGIKGLMIGAIVTGKSPESIKQAVIDFKKAIMEL